MKLSREAQYGLDALAYLAKRPHGTIVQVRHVAEACGLPPLFLAKTFNKLTRYGVLRSYRGRQRGYSLARPAQEITVAEVLEAIEGPDLFTRCLFSISGCSEAHPCLLHSVWKEVRPRVAEMMRQMSLQDVALQT
jgi:Rrf2 family iron-sulfur cluster assembly transcriptional regulator